MLLKKYKQSTKAKNFILNSNNAKQQTLSLIIKYIKAIYKDKELDFFSKKRLMQYIEVKNLIILKI